MCGSGWILPPNLARDGEMLAERNSIIFPENLTVKSFAAADVALVSAAPRLD